MDKELREYRGTQLVHACPLPLHMCGTLRIKVHSDNGESNWLTVNVEELRAIEQVLMREKD